MRRRQLVLLQVSAWNVPGFRAWAVSDRGLVRSENQDAWSVHWDVTGPLGRRHVLAVFDGVGGLPNGAGAAQAAVSALGRHAGAAVEALLGRMNDEVQATGGGTTAVVAVVPVDDPERLELVSVGDSSAYVLDDEGRVVSVAPRDAGRGHEIRDFLGNPGLAGHRVQVTLGEGAGLLLCTDGVDKVVGAPELVPVLSAAPDAVEEAVAALMEQVRERGAPDNATLVVLRRTG